MSTPHLAAQLEHVLRAATLAPSVHNTQPWRFAVQDDGFELHADPGRRLAVLDPDGRQLHLSCGAALLTARVASRALGLDATVELLPEPDRPGLLARLRLAVGEAPQDAEIALALAVLKRHTVRDGFDGRPLPAGVLESLARAAEAEGAGLRLVRGSAELQALDDLLGDAEQVQGDDPDHVRESGSWLRPAESGDGIPAELLPEDVRRGSSVRLLGQHAAAGDELPQLVVVTTALDDARSWLVAGQALGAVLLTAADAGVQAQPLGGLTEDPALRGRLARSLHLTGTPHLVLRMGFAGAATLVGTPRRALDDVLV